MDQRQMRERCPDSKLLGAAVLKDHRLDFTIYSTRWKCGCADVVEDEGKEVWGLVYAVSENDLTRLDGYEGHPVYYRRSEVHVADVTGALIHAYTYKVSTRCPYQAPSPAYLGIIQKAAEEFQFPQGYRGRLERFDHTP